MTERVPRFDAASDEGPIREELYAAVRRVLDRGVYHQGAEGAAFAGDFVERVRSEAPLAGLGVGSGTDALTVALLALGVGPGDEVVTVANAGVAGPTAIRRTGADVVFCDVSATTLLMDSASAASVLGPRTRAVLPVHLYGNVVDIDALRGHVGEVPVVEDCAQAFGSTLRGRSVGTFGDAAAFSFYPTKNLGALGDGGLVLGPPAFVEGARELADYGRGPDGVAHSLGTMSRMDEVQAAALRVKLAHADAALRSRRALAARFDDALPPGLRRVGHGAAGEAAVHLYVVRVGGRSEVRASLTAAGIETGVHYPVGAHRMDAFGGGRRAALPASEAGCSEVLSLPFFPSMQEDAVARVCAAFEALT